MSNLPAGYNEPPDWNDYFDAQDDWIKDHVRDLESQLAAALAKNKELEQRIKESQEQEPVACVRWGTGYGVVLCKKGEEWKGKRLYAAPVISQQPASEPDKLFSVYPAFDSSKLTLGITYIFKYEEKKVFVKEAYNDSTEWFDVTADTSKPDKLLPKDWMVY